MSMNNTSRSRILHLWNGRAVSDSCATSTKVSIYLARSPACSGRNDEEPSAKDSIWKLDRMVSFYLSHSQSSKFLTGGFAKGLQHIDGAAVHHVLQFG